MSLKTISEIAAFVILLALVSVNFSGCAKVFPNAPEMPPGDKKNGGFGEPKVIATIDSTEIRESSGLVASRCQKNVFWTHNDSGDGAFIYAFGRDGKRLGTFAVTDAKNVDWEDIAEFKSPEGRCELYIGDTGNNTRSREEMTIYVVDEPAVSDSDGSSSRRKPVATVSAKSIRFSYPDGRHDSEALMVHPKTGDLYVVTKRLSGASGVYRIKSGYSFASANKTEKVGEISVPAIPNGFLTGGDIAADGTRVILCDYFDAYELTLPPTSKDFDEIWKQTPEIVKLGAREQGESVAYSPDGLRIYATSEKKSPLIQVERK